MRNVFFMMFLLQVSVANLFSQDIVILHTNDLHSHVNGFSPEAEYTPFLNDNDCTRGGFARIAGFIQSEKEKYGDKLLVVDAGDFLMGTLFHSIELSHGLGLNLMHKMGYDYVAIGNHEFDFGPDSLALIISNNFNNGAIPRLLCSNYKQSVNVSDSMLQKHFLNDVIGEYAITERNGYKIGLFALLGIDAVESIPAKYGVETYNYKKTARRIARYMRNVEGVDLVIALSHSGVVKNKKGNWKGEDIALAAVSEIDIVISGHTHTVMKQAGYGNNTPVVQTGTAGVYVGKVEVCFDADRNPLFQNQLLVMDDSVEADTLVQNIIDRNAQLIEETVLSDIGISMDEHIVETSFDLHIDEHNPLQSNLGPFVADAIYYYVDKHVQAPVDVALVATGVIRNNIQTGKKGFQNINDLFNVMPIGMGADKVPGDPLGLVYVTGYELKMLFELILSVYPSKPPYFIYFSGIDIEYDPDKRIFRKIKSIKFNTGTKKDQKIDFDKQSEELIAVVSNAYMIGFISKLRKISFGLVNIEIKNEDGLPANSSECKLQIHSVSNEFSEAKEWLAVYHYCRSFKDVNNNHVPDIPQVYKTMRIPLYKADKQ